MRKTTEERLWAQVDKSGDCWEWTGRSRDAFGYGKIRLSKAEGGRLVGAHRLAWELTNGPIPDGLCVLHDCDNPPCCNPAHLHLGTKGDNMAEKVARGRATTWKDGPWKTCGKGHDDWRVRPSGGRYCRTCSAERQRAWVADNPTYHRDWKRAQRAKPKE